MRTKLLIALLVVVAAAWAMTPTATAHTCSEPNGDCGPCTEGERHEHNDQSGQCSSTASGIPGFDAVLVAAGLLAAVALVTLGRRR